MGLAEVGIILYVLLWIIALVDIMRSKFIKRRYELMWLLIVFLVPFGVMSILFLERTIKQVKMQKIFRDK